MERNTVLAALAAILLFSFAYLGSLPTEKISTAADTKISKSDQALLTSSKIADYSYEIKDKGGKSLMTDKIKNRIDKSTNTLLDCGLLTCDYKIEVTAKQAHTWDNDTLKGEYLGDGVTVQKIFYLDTREVEKSIPTFETVEVYDDENNTYFNKTVENGTVQTHAMEEYENMEISNPFSSDETRTYVLRFAKDSPDRSVDIYHSIYGQERKDAAWWLASGVSAPYWIEPNADIVWIKGNFTNTSNTSFYVYGNGTYARSDGFATFPVFDNFTGVSLNTTIWNMTLSACSDGATINNGLIATKICNLMSNALIPINQSGIFVVYGNGIKGEFANDVNLGWLDNYAFWVDWTAGTWRTELGGDYECSSYGDLSNPHRYEAARTATSATIKRDSAIINTATPGGAPANASGSGKRAYLGINPQNRSGITRNVTYTFYAPTYSPPNITYGAIENGTWNIGGEAFTQRVVVNVSSSVELFNYTVDANKSKLPSFSTLYVTGVEIIQNVSITPAITLANQSFCDNFGDGGSCDRGYNANWMQIATMEASEAWGTGATNITTEYKEGVRSINVSNAKAAVATIPAVDASSMTNMTLWIKGNASGTIRVKIGQSPSIYWYYDFPVTTAWANPAIPLSSFLNVSTPSWSGLTWLSFQPQQAGLTTTVDDLRAVGSNGQFYDTANNVVRWTPDTGTIWEIQNITNERRLVETKHAGDSYIYASTTPSANATYYFQIDKAEANGYKGMFIRSSTYVGWGDSTMYCSNGTISNVSSVGTGKVNVKIITNGATFSAYRMNSTDSDWIPKCLNIPLVGSIQTKLLSSSTATSSFDNILIQSHIPPAVNTTDNSGTFTRAQSLECSALTNSSDGETVCDWYQDGTINQTAPRAVAYYPMDAPHSNATFTQDMAITPTANATVSGATWTSNCMIGGCYYFNTNDYVDAALQSNFTHFTWLFWVKPDASLALMNLLTAGTYNPTTYINSTSGLVGWYTGGGGVNAVTCNATAGKWTHIAYMGNATAGYIFCNGVQKTSGVMDFGSLSTSPLHIGKKYDVEWLNGSIDDVRIYNQSLTADEIGQIYRDGMVGKTLPANTANMNQKWYANMSSALRNGQTQNLSFHLSASFGNGITRTRFTPIHGVQHNVQPTNQTASIPLLNISTGIFSGAYPIDIFISPQINGFAIKCAPNYNQTGLVNLNSSPLWITNISSPYGGIWCWADFNNPAPGLKYNITVVQE